MPDHVAISPPKCVEAPAHAIGRSQPADVAQRASSPHVARLAALQHDLDGSPRVAQLQTWSTTTGARAPVQCASMEDVNELFERYPELRKVFRYWIHYAARNNTNDRGQRYQTPQAVLEDSSIGEIRESLQVWAQGANFEYLKKAVADLDTPTEQIAAKTPNVKELQGPSMEELSQAEHLEAARKMLADAKYLVRKVNGIEANMFATRGNDIDALRPKGLLNKDAFPVERSIAFSVDGEHTFSDSSRNRDQDAYSHVVRIPLTEFLKRYLTSNLWNTNRKGGYKSNPQFKLEHKKYNVVIPETGWSAFWGFGEGAIVTENESKEDESKDD